jgi:paraquat-inducible protein B
MARKVSPVVLGAFVLGAMVLAITGLVVIGGGKFFRSTEGWVAYFDESIKGLSVGSPVTFRGVKVGSVTNVKVVLNRETLDVRTPVFFELDADRVTVDGGKIRFTPGGRGALPLIERGLRAQLETLSFVTGQLAVNLEFRPDTPIRLVGGPEKYPEFPTIPSTMAALGRGLEELNTAELARDIQDIASELAKLVKGPELKSALVNVNVALKSIDRLAVNADQRVGQLGKGADDTLQAAQTLLRHVDSQTVPALNDSLKQAQQLLQHADSQTLVAATETLRDAQHLVRRVDNETVPTVNQFITELRPLVEDVMKTSTAARSALQHAETLLSTADTVLEDGSPLRYDVSVALREVASAARAFRILSSYLERHPNSVIFGRDQQRGQ